MSKHLEKVSAHIHFKIKCNTFSQVWTLKICINKDYSIFNETGDHIIDWITFPQRHNQGIKIKPMKLQKHLIFLVFLSSFIVLQRSRIKYKKNSIYTFDSSKHAIQLNTFMQRFPAYLRHATHWTRACFLCLNMRLNF